MTHARGIDPMTFSWPLALLALGFGALSVQAAAPRLLKDVNPDLELASSNPYFLGQVNGRAILAAGDGQANVEPIVSDGTNGGTRNLADICPGECSSDPQAFGQSRRAAFFTARPDSRQPELWATDGTRAGTVRVGAFPTFFRIPGSPQPALQPISPEGDRLYFAGSDPVNGDQLWVSDGTPAGTFALTHFDRPQAEDALQAIVPLGQGAIFLARGESGLELWSSDGTVAGTRRLRPVPGSTDPEEPLQLFRAGRYVYFTASVGRLGRELWRTDGTPAGTVNVADLVRGPRSIEIYWGATLGSRFLFAAYTPQAGTELWITDGTSGGTRALTRFLPPFPFDDNSTNPLLDGLTGADLGTKALFEANDGVHGRELWVTDGTSAGTRLLRDIQPGAAPGPSQFLSDGSGATPRRAYFFADDGAHGFEVWTSDGTPAGTKMVRDICRGVCSPALVGSWPVGSSLLLIVQNQGGGRINHELWRTDGTPSGTFRLSFHGPVGGSFQRVEVIALGGLALFANTDVNSGRELWRSDLTRAGTSLAVDLAPEFIGASSDIALFLSLGSDVLFLERARDGAIELWRSDGSEAGTRRVRSLGPGTPDGSFSAEAGGNAFFLLDHDLWRTDGMDAGTFRLSPPGTRVPDVRHGGITFLISAGDRVYFSLSDAEHGAELWTSDGSVAGTKLVIDLIPGNGGSVPGPGAALGGKFVFVGFQPQFGFELWITDGSAAGTRLVRDITPGPASSALFAFSVHDGLLYFVADDTSSQLWRTDGTTSGTFVALSQANVPSAQGFLPVGEVGGLLRLDVHSLDPAVAGTYLYDGTLPSLRRLFPAQPSVAELTQLGSRLLWTTGGQWELRVADGTPATARPLLDEHGDPVAGIRFLGRLGNQELLASFDGLDLWETDGTPAGTRRFERLRLSLGSPPHFLIVGGKAYFLATDALHGVEPWVLAGD